MRKNWFAVCLIIIIILLCLINEMKDRQLARAFEMMVTLSEQIENQK